MKNIAGSANISMRDAAVISNARLAPAPRRAPNLESRSDEPTSAFVIDMMFSREV
ncbi:hypothetical protein D3C87_1696370 [compost metagenome]